MIFSCIVLTLGMWHAVPYHNEVSVAGVMLFVWFFEIGLGPIPWLIVAEMFPAKPRPTAMSVATMVNWSFSFVVGLTFPMLQSHLGKNAFVPFTLALVIAFAFTFKFVPETKGKTLEEIQHDMQQM
jgi:SP family facilitated glucose transporter-like MFS transporter 3